MLELHARGWRSCLESYWSLGLSLSQKAGLLPRFPGVKRGPLVGVTLPTMSQSVPFPLPSLTSFNFHCALWGSQRIMTQILQSHLIPSPSPSLISGSVSFLGVPSSTSQFLDHPSSNDPGLHSTPALCSRDHILFVTISHNISFMHPTLYLLSYLYSSFSLVYKL